MNRLIGLIVNPVAGMGGSVGLKGTDGKMYKKALELGAEPVTPKRTNEVLSHIEKKDHITLVVAPGDGTARDVYDAIRSKIPVVAVPAGVKVLIHTKKEKYS